MGIHVISPHSEAVFVYAGAMLSAMSTLEPALCMDLGGGSTEVVVGDKGRPTTVCEVALGSTKLLSEMQTLADTGVAAVEEIAACQTHVRRHLQQADTAAVRSELVRARHPRHCLFTLHAPCAHYSADGFFASPAALLDACQCMREWHNAEELAACRPGCGALPGACRSAMARLALSSALAAS